MLLWARADPARYAKTSGFWYFNTNIFQRKSTGYNQNRRDAVDLYAIGWWCKKSVVFQGFNLVTCWCCKLLQVQVWTRGIPDWYHCHAAALFSIFPLESWMMPSSSLMPITRAVGTCTPQKDAHTFTLALADIAVVGRQNEHPCWHNFLGSSLFLRPFPSAAVALRDNNSCWLPRWCRMMQLIPAQLCRSLLGIRCPSAFSPTVWYPKLSHKKPFYRLKVMLNEKAFKDAEKNGWLHVF